MKYTVRNIADLMDDKVTYVCDLYIAEPSAYEPQYEFESGNCSINKSGFKGLQVYYVDNDGFSESLYFPYESEIKMGNLKNQFEVVSEDGTMCRLELIATKKVDLKNLLNIK